MTPLLEARWHIGDAEAGLLFTSQFLASVFGAAWVGPLARRFGYAALIAVGLLLTAAGMAGCALAAWPLALLAAAGYGFGLGLAVPAGNLAVARGDGDGARALVWLKWSWCVGAVAAPALTAWRGMAVWWMGAAGLAICAAWIAEPPAPLPAAAGARVRARISHVAIFAGVFLFVYVATEQALSGWVASLALRSQATARFWAAAPSIFWAGMLAGRALTPLLLNRRRPPVIVFTGLATAAAGAMILIAAHSPAFALGAGAICGIGLAPIYPLVVAQYAESENRSLSGLVFACGGLGGAVGPLATGFRAQSSGSLRVGLACALPALAVMAGIEMRLARA